MIRDIPIDAYLRERGWTTDLAATRVASCPKTIGVFRLRRGWIENPTWIPITDDRVVFLNFSQIYAASSHASLFTEEFAAALDDTAPDEIGGAFVVGGESNYWHMIMDFLPRLIFLKARPDLRGRPLVLGRGTTAGQRELIVRLLKRLNLPVPEMMFLGTGVHRLRDCWIPSSIDRCSAVAIWDAYLRPTLPTGTTGPERLFVVRTAATAHHRRLVNQEEIAAKLAEIGFVCIDPGTLAFEEQVALFSRARLVVGVHGAGLTNLLFSPPGGVLVELFTTRPQPFFEDLAARRGWRHVSISGTNLGSGTSQHDDFHVPPDVVIDVVERVIRTEANLNTRN